MDFWFSVLNTIDGEYWSQFKYCYLIALSLSLFCLRYDAFYRLLFISLISDEMPQLCHTQTTNIENNQNTFLMQPTECAILHIVSHILVTMNEYFSNCLIKYASIP